MPESVKMLSIAGLQCVMLLHLIRVLTEGEKAAGAHSPGPAHFPPAPALAPLE